MEKLTREQADKIRVAGDFRAEDIGRKVHQIAAKKAAKIQEEGEILAKKVRELSQKKIEILKSPRPKSDMLEIALKSFFENKKYLFDEFLVPLLKNAQEQRWNSVFEDHIRLPIDLLKITFGIFSEEDVRKAVEVLPSEGRTKEEIKRDVAKIEDQIESLGERIGQLESEL
jgi:hypothetical protein